MTKIECKHKWTMTNIHGGYLVIEGCAHCGNRISFFSEEPVPPIDSYREDEHFWCHLGGYQASKFDLKCEKCLEIIPLNKVVALMMCMNCDSDCGVFKASSHDKDHRTWVYVALCANTSHSSGKCISDEGINALNEYFNQGIKDPSKKIAVVPCSLRKSVDTCQGIVLADVGLTELY